MNTRQTRPPGPQAQLARGQSTAKNNGTGITALYSRLSREDILSGDSLSIQNQKEILVTYAQQHGFPNFRHFYDDGTTGVHFDRDGWKLLMEEVDAGRVSTVITKDAYVKVKTTNIFSFS